MAYREQSLADTLLFERETTNLKYTIGGRLLFGLGMVVGEVFTSETQFEMVFAIPIIVTVIAISILSYVLLNRNKAVKFAAYSGIVIDCFLLTVLPYIWYHAVHGQPAQIIYVSKTVITIMSMVMIVYNSLAVRPSYPAIITVYALMIHIAIAIGALNSPDTQFTTDGYLFRMGPQFSMFLYGSQTAFMVGLGGLLTFLTWSARRTIISSIHFEKTNSYLNRYFSPNIAEQISRADDEFINLGGRLQRISVLFCDLQGFTSISERLNPTEVVQLLSSYHEVMVAAIFRYGGTLDKFIGDGIMATFGTPEPRADSSTHAAYAALAMRRELTELNRRNKNQNLPQLKQRIGIHTGEAIVGNIGTKDRLEFTAIGDTVNVASRIESACKQMNQDILMSKTVYEEVSHTIDCSYVGTITLRGKTAATELYTLNSPVTGT